MKSPDYKKTSESEAQRRLMKEGFEAYLKARRATKRSIAHRIKVINLYCKWLDKEQLEPEQVTYNDLLTFMKHCSQNGASQNTVLSYIGCIKHLYNYLVREERIASNPTQSIEVKGVKRKVLYHLLESHELHALYNQHNDESLKGRRDQVILGLLVYQGLKVEELRRLEVSHLKMREGQIDVPGGPKTNGRILQLKSHQVMDVYDYVLQVRPSILQQSGKQTDKLFVSPAGGDQISNFISRLMQRLKKINSRVVNAKQIRASVITNWLRTHNLRAVQHLAGHRYISSTESYQHNDLQSLQEEINLYHPMV